MEIEVRPVHDNRANRVGILGGQVQRSGPIVGEHGVTAGGEILLGLRHTQADLHGPGGGLALFGRPQNHLVTEALEMRRHRQ